MTDASAEEAVQQKQEISGIFDRAAAAYDHVGPRFFSYFGRRLVEIASIPGGAQVLDVATGRGAVLFPAAEAVGAGGHVTGIDLSANMAQETMAEATRLGLAANIQVRQMDAEALQFPDASFDMVLCGFALFFFPRLSLALSELRRVLKPGGRLAVTTWGRLPEKKWLNDLINAYLPPEPEPEQPAAPDSPPQPVFHTPEGMQEMMRIAEFTGLQIVAETVDFIYASQEEYWTTQWSHGMRGALEEIERKLGAEGLARFKTEVFGKVAAIRQPDGLHEPSAVLYTISIKP